jgi:hypothetical protein
MQFCQMFSDLEIAKLGLLRQRFVELAWFIAEDVR